MKVLNMPNLVACFRLETTNCMQNYFHYCLLVVYKGPKLLSANQMLSIYLQLAWPVV